VPGKLFDPLLPSGLHLARRMLGCQGNYWGQQVASTKVMVNQTTSTLFYSALDTSRLVTATNS